MTETPDADDERSGWSDEDYQEAEATQFEMSTVTLEAAARKRGLAEFPAREKELLDQMRKIADRARQELEAKTKRLIAWIRDNLCADLPPFGQVRRNSAAKPRWNDRRVLIFTENRASTKRYLRKTLEQAIEDTDQAEDRIAVIDGLTSGPTRKEIQRRFNADPAKEPLRILLATDAAREGLNFQAHCADLFHYDLPWNPGRIEQRNGRIDRKLQPEPEVRCYYFDLPQRVEDRVLRVLVRKTETIKKELGSLSKVIDDDVERQLKSGIRHKDADQLAQELRDANIDTKRKQVSEEELEGARERQHDLERQHKNCQKLVQQSREWTGFQPEPFRQALSAALRLLTRIRCRKQHPRMARRLGRFRHSIARQKGIRAGPRRSTPCGCRASLTRSWPNGERQLRSGRWCLRTLGCSRMTSYTYTWNRGWRSGCWHASGRRVSFTTISRELA